MHAVLKIAIASLCLVVASAGQLPYATDLKLMQLFAQSRDLLKHDPIRAEACFDYYMPLVIELGNEYERDYNTCLRQADTARVQLDVEWQPKLLPMKESAQSSCQQLSHCVTFTDSILYLECFESVAAKNSKTMNGISVEASKQLVEVREEYRLIDNEENSCTRDTYLAYKEEYDGTVAELNECLTSKTPVPTTTTPAPVGTTTDEVEVAAFAYNQPADVNRLLSKYPRKL